MFQTTVRNGNKFTQEVSTKQNVKSLVIVKLMTFSWTKWLRYFSCVDYIVFWPVALPPWPLVNGARISACVKASISKPDNDILYGHFGAFYQLKTPYVEYMQSHQFSPLLRGVWQVGYIGFLLLLSKITTNLSDYNNTDLLCHSSVVQKSGYIWLVSLLGVSQVKTNVMAVQSS